MRASAHSSHGPTEIEIQHAAYLLWIEEGRPEGRDLDHWLAAQHLLRHRAARRLPASTPRTTGARRKH